MRGWRQAAGKPDVSGISSTAESNGEKLPTTIEVFNEHPRLVPNAGRWRDRKLMKTGCVAQDFL
jgi:hypothetical protein